MKPLYIHLLFFIAIFLGACQHKIQEKASNITVLNIGASAWQVLPIDVEDDGKEEIFLGLYKGAARLCDNEGNTLWEYTLDGFPFSLASADLDQDKKKDFLVATSAGSLFALNAKGEELWSFKSKQPLYNVVTGQFQNNKTKIVAGGIDRKVYIFDTQGNLLNNAVEVNRLVHRMLAANFDQDPTDELLVISHRDIASLFEIDQDKISLIWEKPLKVPQRFVNWENPRGSFYAFSVDAVDLDEDGSNEIVMGDTYFNKQPVMATNALGESLWITEEVPFTKIVDSLRNTEFFSEAQVLGGDFAPSVKGNEILSLAGGTFRLIDQSGKILGEAESAIGFTDMAYANGKLYLSSSPNGDENIYVLNWNENTWQKDVGKFERSDKVATIAKSIQAIIEQAEALPNESEKHPINYLIGTGGAPLNEQALKEYRQFQAWWQAEFPYNNLKTNRTLKVIENKPPKNPQGEPWHRRRWETDAIRGTNSVEEILGKVRFLEEHSIPTKLNIGHSVMPFITLNTAEKILETGPNAILGFNTAEDEAFERLPEYLEHFYKPLMQLCKEHDKFCITKNKNVWWMNTPAHAHLANKLLPVGNQEIIKAATEDSNSRTPEINLMSRLGLYLAGRTSGQIVNVHRDLFSFNRYHEWEYPKHGHPFLRLMLAHTLLGGDHFNLRFPYYWQNDGEIEFTRMGEESVKPFFTLLGKGIVWKPNAEEMANINPLGIVVHPPSEAWIRDGINGHSPETWQPNEDLENAVIPFNGTNWGLYPTPDFALQKILFNKKYQFGSFVPATPYGLVTFVPAHFDRADFPHVKEWIHTDGTYIWKDGSEKLNGPEAAELIKAAFQDAAKGLKFRIEGDVFMQALQLDEKTYRIFLIDSGWVDPAERNVKITCQISEQVNYKDVLSGESVNPASVTVPAGVFRVVDAYIQ